ncbi:hypothetical protein NEOC95_000786 [Neochlamydia sp. AcF95]|nr:hypothetical protein [Neochlamydia sp. AcF95]
MFKVYEKQQQTVALILTWILLNLFNDLKKEEGLLDLLRSYFLIGALLIESSLKALIFCTEEGLKLRKRKKKSL